MKAYPTLTALVSGGDTRSSIAGTEAKQMQDYMVKQGIMSARVAVEMRAGSTWGNAIYSIPLVKAPIYYIVSDQSHMMRAYIFLEFVRKVRLSIPDSQLNCYGFYWYADSSKQDGGTVATQLRWLLDSKLVP